MKNGVAEGVASDSYDTNGDHIGCAPSKITLEFDPISIESLETHKKIYKSQWYSTIG